MDVFDFLKYSLDGKRDLLKFAEAKNATLLVASSGVFALLLQAYSKEQSIYEHPFTLLLAALFLVCALMSAWSFLPQSRRGQQKNSLEFPHDSLLYYKDVTSFTVAQYSDVLINLQTDNSAIARVKEDFIEQIILNSRIINRKMRYFTIGIYLFLSGLIGILLSVAIKFIGC